MWHLDTFVGPLQLLLVVSFEQTHFPTCIISTGPVRIHEIKISHPLAAEAIPLLRPGSFSRPLCGPENQIRQYTEAGRHWRLPVYPEGVGVEGGAEVSKGDSGTQLPEGAGTARKDMCSCNMLFLGAEKTNTHTQICQRQPFQMATISEHCYIALLGWSSGSKARPEVWIPSPSLPSCVTSGNSLNPSVSHFPLVSSVQLIFYKSGKSQRKPRWKISACVGLRVGSCYLRRKVFGG